MFRRILIPWATATHAAPAQQDTLALARSIATRTGATIILAHLLADAGITPRDNNGGTRGERAEVERVAQHLREQGIDAEAITETGPVAEGILRIAHTNQADVVALAPPHHVAFADIWQPDLTRRILATLSLPVLITPRSPVPPSTVQRALRLLSDPYASVIVPLDGSALAERALPHAQTFAEVYHRPLLLTRVVKPVTAYVTPAASTVLVMAEEEANAQEARRYLDLTRTRLAQQATQPVHVLLRVGQPADEICQALKVNAGSLVVMSTHGRSGVTRALWGSVTTAVMRQTVAPLLMVPNAAPALGA